MLVVKKLCETRWSSRHDAVHALTMAFKEHIKLLGEIGGDSEVKAAARWEAQGLVNKLLQKEYALLHLNDDLERVNKTNVLLQKEGCPLNTAFQQLNSLSTFIKSLRDKYEYFEEKAHNVGATACRMESRRERRHQTPPPIPPTLPQPTNLNTATNNNSASNSAEGETCFRYNKGRSCCNCLQQGFRLPHPATQCRNTYYEVWTFLVIR